MIYLPSMKKITRIIVIISLALLLAILVTAFTQVLASQATQAQAEASAALVLQATPTPEPEDLSEIGSTDGIVAMGGVITLIVIVPILIRRKYWIRQPSQ